MQNYTKREHAKMGILSKTKDSFFNDYDVTYNPLVYSPLPYIHIVNIMSK